MDHNYKTRLKRITSVLLSFSLIFASLAPGASFAEDNLMSSKVLAYHKPNVTILFNAGEMGFFDANKNPVYPIIYNGSAYIPLRGASALMGENIEWEPLNQIVFMGKTISQPYKGTAVATTQSSLALVPMDKRPEQEIITVYSKPDVKIMFDFELQAFEDANKRRVYPIIYKGSTYLPVRAVSRLMGASIEWDSKTQTISISKETIITDAKSEATLALRDLFNQAVELYNQSTAKISTLKATNEPLVLKELAKSVSLDYKIAQDNGNVVKAMDKSNFTDPEKLAHEKLQAFLELAEYYTLVLENISYMAVNGQDYSMFAETFLTFALESAAKMDQARVAIEAL
ncbi:MAG: copper amine oxidase N-terminal domain-containing protein [Anaerovoracaceae bacterium]|jgi:hypothetical protein|nr:copper amine oxidase N-terminal domain-containing protein [Anaerovoracaceae bacterium]